MVALIQRVGPGWRAVRLGLPAAVLLGLGAAVALWKWRLALAAAGWPASGEALTSNNQLIPFGLSIAWRSLAAGLGAGAVGCGLAALAGWWLRREDGELPALATPGPGLAAWPTATAAAVLGFGYGFMHRTLGPSTTGGDEASYIERGMALAKVLRQADVGGLIHWFDLAGHRPWPGLLPTYIAVLAGLPVPAMVGLQAAASWGLLAWGVVRLGRVLSVRPAAVAVVLALLLTQPILRSEATVAMADGMVAGALALAFAELLGFLYQPSAQACMRAGLAVALPVAMKPSGNLWSVLPLGLAAGVWLLFGERRVRNRLRAAWLAELAVAVVAGATLTALVAGGPKTWWLIGRHGTSVEGLGYYDEAVGSLGDKLHWLLVAVPRLATVPLWAAALWGVLRGPRPLRVVAGLAVLLPLAIHALAMESKSMRLVGYALIGMAALALPAVDALVLRLPRALPWVVAVGLAGALLGRDLADPTPEDETLALNGPLRPGDWSELHLTWLGSHRISTLRAQMQPAARALAAQVAQHCDRKATTPLFLIAGFVVDPSDSSYGTGLGTSDYYAPELKRLSTEPLFAERACLVVHSGGAMYWPGGHGRLHGEGLITSLAQLVQDRANPLAQPFEPTTTVPLPDGTFLTIYRRRAAATLTERAAWADQLAAWMPEAGVWAETWRQVAEDQLAAGVPAGEACRNLRRAAHSRPVRGLLACERVDADLCLNAVLPARKASARAKELGCEVLSDSALWPAGIPAWIAATARPRLDGVPQ
ncbi:MAG: hypothetical protein HY902_16360 [Deltaproteobacteria bacterium]|nr:hypothetical protein [Deltaproteobacteria bacterium]